MRKKVKSKYSFLDTLNLNKLFEEKGWTGMDEFTNFFENYCLFMERLNSKQHELVKDLTMDFLWLRSSDYYKHLKRTLLKLEKYTFLNLDTVYIVPLLAKSDREAGKTKSSNAVAYTCQNPELKYSDLFTNTDFRIIDNIDRLPSVGKLKNSKNPILLIDDYIGTGDTALEALEEVLGLRLYDKETLFVASLVCQETGIKVINNKGYDVLTDVIRKKGISDKYEGDELIRNIKLMESIEEILQLDSKFDPKYNFGYKHSEGLVAMTRTPNNTFPLYWFKAQLDKANKWKAPFPR
ncbi:phosphoribosyltransferase-like protein [Tenacibaculum maritimum]|uniref:phosphoribosyltransferase-like protein n=1 Tax=Tenacibaculum maritimum TaxID=107401 RepID=UPI0012E6DE0A|nr:hypothetical protein [Tenacibaculum maritimum]MCD9581256.1 hypothetical protein [Tenacibaculum maritimum]MCD9635233.1 hypothetical protein [Tenacibaculum maritimum]CAA0260715.1 conserved hypothetical protein [Tenacibaculum maritimum]